MPPDLVLRGATVVDGTGAPPVVADVVVDGDRVTAVDADRSGATARRAVDAEGLVVCPGFVDVHTHYDAQLLWDPTASPSTQHGVTTVLAGNCGFSIAPLSDDSAEYVERMMAVVEGIPLAALEGGGPWDWRSFGDYLARLDGRVAVNAGFLVGHSTVRRLVLGDDATSKAATPEQLAELVAVVERSLAEGALGFSSSLGEGHVDGDGQPVPSRAAAFDELVALAAALRRHPGTTLELIPTVGPIAEERMRLMADMSAAADRPLNWNLLGSLASEEIHQQQLRSSDVAAERGGHVVALTLPDLMRMRAGNVLPSLPGWAEVLDLDEAGRRAAVADPDVRARLRAGAEEVAERAMGVLADLRRMEVADVDSPWADLDLAAIAERRGTDVVDVLLDVVLVEGLTLDVVLPSLAPTMGRSDEGWAQRVSVWRDQRVMLGGSDAGAHLDLMCHAGYPTVVLGEAVRRRGLLPIEEAVHLMTGRPAAHYGLRDRGRVAAGCVADLVLLDPSTVASAPTVVRRDLPGGGERLYTEAIGIDRVLVGGVEVVVAGEATGARPGTVLRSGRDTETVTVADLRR